MRGYFRINNFRVAQKEDRIGRPRRMWVLWEDAGKIPREIARGKDFDALCARAVELAMKPKAAEVKIITEAWR